MSDKMQRQCETWPNMTFQPITDAQANGVACAILIAFFLAVPLHVLNLLAAVKHRKALLQVHNLPEMALLLSDLGVLGLHPFSGSCAAVRKWIWGRAGCQLYAFFGFFFGTFQLFACTMVTYARMKALKEGDSQNPKLFKKYVIVTVLLLAFSFFWSICPIIGWGQYNLTPTGITCTIDWINNDVAYVTYMITYTVFAYVLPFVLNVWYMALLLKVMSASRQRPVPWARKCAPKFIALCCAFGTFVAFSGYGGVCIYAIVANPNDMSIDATLLPPPMAKMAAVVNAIFFVVMNPTVWAAIRELFGFSYDATLLAERKYEDEDDGKVECVSLQKQK